MNRELITALCLTMDKQALDKEAINWDEAWDTAVNNWGKFTDKVKEVYRKNPEAAGTGTGVGLALLLYGLTTPKGDHNLTGAAGSAGIGGVIGYLLGNSGNLPKPDVSKDPPKKKGLINKAYERYTSPDVSDKNKILELLGLGAAGYGVGSGGVKLVNAGVNKGVNTAKNVGQKALGTSKAGVKKGVGRGSKALSRIVRKGAPKGVNKGIKAISGMGRLGRLAAGIGGTWGIDAIVNETGMAFKDPDTGKLTLPTVNTDKWLKRRRGHFENYFDKTRDYGRISDNKLDLATNLYKNTMGDATLLWDTGKALQGAFAHKLKDFMGNKDFDAGTKKLYTKIRDHIQKGELDKARQIFEGRHLTTFKDNTFDELVNKYK